jgi:hypothetical protein
VAHYRVFLNGRRSLVEISCSVYVFLIAGILLGRRQGQEIEMVPGPVQWADHLFLSGPAGAGFQLQVSKAWWLRLHTLAGFSIEKCHRCCHA